MKNFFLRIKRGGEKLGILVVGLKILNSKKFDTFSYLCLFKLLKFCKSKKDLLVISMIIRGRFYLLVVGKIGGR